MPVRSIPPHLEVEDPRLPEYELTRERRERRQRRIQRANQHLRGWIRR